MSDQPAAATKRPAPLPGRDELRARKRLRLSGARPPLPPLRADPAHHYADPKAQNKVDRRAASLVLPGEAVALRRTWHSRIPDRPRVTSARPDRDHLVFFALTQDYDVIGQPGDVSPNGLPIGGFTVCLHGVTADGVTATVRLTGCRPHCAFRPPDAWTPDHIACAVASLGDVLQWWAVTGDIPRAEHNRGVSPAGSARDRADMGRLGAGLVSHETLYAHNLRHYDGPDPRRFVRLYVSHPRLVPRLRELLEHTGGRSTKSGPLPLWLPAHLPWDGRRSSVPVFEANIDFSVRFLAGNRLEPSSWYVLGRGRWDRLGTYDAGRISHAGLEAVAHISALHQARSPQDGVDARPLLWAVPPADHVPLPSELTIDVWRSPGAAELPPGTPITDVLPELLVCGWDIEAHPDGERFPKSERCPVLQVSMVFHFLNAPATRTEFVIVLGDVVGPPAGHCVVCTTEARLLTAERDAIIAADPDVLLTYNGNGFDFPYQRDRAGVLGLRRFTQWSRVMGCPFVSRNDRLGGRRGAGDGSRAQGSRKAQAPSVTMRGRLCVDLYTWASGVIPKFPGLSLGAVSRSVLGMTKVDFDYSQIAAAQKTPVGRANMSVYTLVDARLCNMIDVKKNVVKDYLNMSRINRVAAQQTVDRGQEFKILGRLLYYAAAEAPHPYLMPSLSRDVRQVDKYKGAEVQNAYIGLYLRWLVVTLDYKSLYPTIMMLRNLCYCTIATPDAIRRYGLVEGRDYWVPFTVPEDKQGGGYDMSPVPVSDCGGVFLLPPSPDAPPGAHRRRGILSFIEIELFNLRQAVKARAAVATGDLKAQLGSYEKAIKVYMNSAYGITGNASSSLPSRLIAMTITGQGRWLNRLGKVTVERNYNTDTGYGFNARVVYGDSVTGATPLLVRWRRAVYNNQFHATFVTASELGAGPWRPCDHAPDKEWSPPRWRGAESWAGGSWTPILRVIRHRTTKPIVRVVCDAGFVDVTTDHSLMIHDPASGGTVIKASPSDLRVGESRLWAPPQPTDTPASWSTDHESAYDDAYNLMYTARAINRSGRPDTAVAVVGDQLQAARLFTTTRACNAHVGVGLAADGASAVLSLRVGRVDPATLSDNVARAVVAAPADAVTDYVYDLTTGTGCFAAGVGRLIVHNTDSVMVALVGVPRELGLAYSLGNMLAERINAEFPKPVEMEAEGVQENMNSQGKKKYGSMLHLPWVPGARPPPVTTGRYAEDFEHRRRDGAPHRVYEWAASDLVGERYIKGMDAVRKSTTRWLAQMQTDVMEAIVADGDPEKGLGIAQRRVADMLAGRVPTYDVIERSGLSGTVSAARDPTSKELVYGSDGRLVVNAPGYKTVTLGVTRATQMIRADPDLVLDSRDKLRYVIMPGGKGDKRADCVADPVVTIGPQGRLYDVDHYAHKARTSMHRVFAPIIGNCSAVLDTHSGVALPSKPELKRLEARVDELLFGRDNPYLGAKAASKPTDGVLARMGATRRRRCAGCNGLLPVQVGRGDARACPLCERCVPNVASLRTSAASVATAAAAEVRDCRSTCERCCDLTGMSYDTIESCEQRECENWWSRAAAAAGAAAASASLAALTTDW